MKNGTMLQGFEWELPADGALWRRLRRDAFRLRRMGFTAVWLPPAYKGCAGPEDVGYGVYDLYDLGEFHQKGAIRTKYGTKAEYLAAIRALRAADVQAIADVVLNHRLGADGSETVTVCVEDPEHRGGNHLPERTARIFTRFSFPGRRDRYSEFQWDYRCFTGVDWDENSREKGLFRIKGKQWMADVDQEKGNYDYLMGADVDMGSPDVVAELRRWGHWYADTTCVDGFRLDAVKHISAAFYRDWLPDLRAYTGRELFTVGEYWHDDVNVLLDYLQKVQCDMSLFDVPLHQHLREASNSGGQYDMRRLFEGTLVGCRPHLAVTFVDNHDTQPGQSLESWVGGWFKAAAYGLILLRAFGYPCVFWGDLYGIPTEQIGAVTELPLLLRLRRTNAYGEEHDYFDDASVIGFTREGTADEPGSGLAFLCTEGLAGEKSMYIGKNFAGRVMHCVLGGQNDVRIDAAGCGIFRVKDGGVSIYVPRMTAQEALRRARRDIGQKLNEQRRWSAWALQTLKNHENGRNG